MLDNLCFILSLRGGNGLEMRVNTILFPTSEEDTRFLDSLIYPRQLDPREIVALLCKMQGSAIPNDFSEELKPYLPIQALNVGDEG